MPERLTQFDDLHAQYRTAVQQRDQEAAVRQALAHLDHQAGDAQRSYVEIVRRLHTALQQILDTAASPAP